MYTCLYRIPHACLLSIHIYIHQSAFAKGVLYYLLTYSFLVPTLCPEKNKTRADIHAHTPATTAKIKRIDAHTQAHTRTNKQKNTTHVVGSGVQSLVRSRPVQLGAESCVLLPGRLQHLQSVIALGHDLRQCPLGKDEPRRGGQSSRCWSVAERRPFLFLLAC